LYCRNFKELWGKRGKGKKVMNKTQKNFLSLWTAEYDIRNTNYRRGISWWENYAALLAM
jgi:hypothetical protein